MPTIAALFLIAAFQEQIILRDLNGAPRKLSEYRGQVVVLNFWATWCIPCREEMPMLSRTHIRYGPRHVVVLGVSADDASTESQIPGFVQKLGIPFPIWKGATTGDMELLGLGTGLPATAMLDQEGRIRFRIRGVVTKKDLDTRLEFLLGDRRNSPPELLDRMHHDDEELHNHGGVGMEGASTVPS